MPPAQPSPGSSANADTQREIEQLRQQVEMLKLQLEQQRKKLDLPNPETRSTAAAAQVTIRLPADAKLFIDDVVCPLTSDTRSFATPQLQPGQVYYYTVRAEVARGGATLSDTQRVVFEAGQKVSVEFPKLAVAATPSN